MRRVPVAWQTRTVTNIFTDRQWLTLSETAEALGVTQSRVRKLIEERQLLAVKRDGILSVPADFLRDDEPLSELRGTLYVLADAGFDDDEAMQWLLTDEESLLVPPIDALRAGRKAEVRRVAQALA